MALRGHPLREPVQRPPVRPAARAAVDTAREQVAALIGANPDEIVFTSGGTESNNLAIRGTAATMESAGRHVVTSAVEHPATVQPVRQLAEAGWDVTTLGVDGGGRIDPGAGAGDTPVGLATFILAQNEVGTIQPIAELAEALHARGALVHADAAQAVGKVRVAVDDLGVDLLSIAGHKCYAPKGVARSTSGAARHSPRSSSVPVRSAGSDRGRRTWPASLRWVPPARWRRRACPRNRSGSVACVTISGRS